MKLSTMAMKVIFKEKFKENKLIGFPSKGFMQQRILENNFKNLSKRFNKLNNRFNLISFIITLLALLIL